MRGGYQVKTVRFNSLLLMKITDPEGGGDFIFGWGCASGTLEPLAYARAGSAEFCYPILN